MVKYCLFDSIKYEEVSTTLIKLIQRESLLYLFIYFTEDPFLISKGYLRELLF